MAGGQLDPNQFPTDIWQFDPVTKKVSLKEGWQFVVSQTSGGLVDFSGWKTGGTMPPIGFTMEGTSSGNSLVTISDTFGFGDVAWRCGGVSAEAEGFSVDFEVDYTKTYRIICFLRKSNAAAGGVTTFGAAKNSSLSLAGGDTDGNFISTQLTSENGDLILVGVIHPNGYTGADSTVTGVYDAETFEKLADGVELQHKSMATKQSFRIGFLSSDASEYQYVWHCIVQQVSAVANTVNTVRSSCLNTYNAASDQVNAPTLVLPTEKPRISVTWNEINGNGSTTGTYWSARAKAVASSISTTALDAAYEALETALFDDPAILEPTTWQTPVAISSLDWWETLWETYYTAEIGIGLSLAETAYVEAQAASKAYLGMLSSDPASALEGQFYFNATLDPKAFRRYTDGDWETVLPTDPLFSYYIGAAVNDIVSVDITEDDSTTGGITFFENLIAKNLYARAIKILTGGSIRGGDRYDETGALVDEAAQGYWQGANGQSKVGGPDSEYSTEDGAMTAYSDTGLRRRYVRLSENAARWGNAPDGGTETEVARMIRMDVASDAVLLDGEFVGNIESKWSAEGVINGANSSTPAFIEQSNGTLRIAYRRFSDGYIIERIWDGNTWGAEVVVNAAQSEDPTYVELLDGELRIAYSRTAELDLVERIWNGSSWGAESIIYASGSFRPKYIQRGNGELRIIFTAGASYAGDLVEKIWTGSAWGDTQTITTDDSDEPTAIELNDGQLRLAYRKDSNGYLLERIWNDTTETWSDATTINGASSYDPTYIQLANGELRIAYKQNTTYYIIERIWNGSSWGTETTINSSVSHDPAYIQRSNGELRIGYIGTSSYLYERRLERYAPIATVKTNMGLKRGLMFRYSTTDTLAYEKGIVEVNNGTSSKLVVVPSDGTLDVSSMSNGEWKFICITQDGTLSLEAATGAGSVRPSDTCFTYNGGTGSFLNVGKYGYYLSATKRIIAAVHQVSTTSFYIINLGSGIEEWGKNSNGEWHIHADGTLEQGALLLTTSGGSSGTGKPHTYYELGTWTYPVPFTALIYLSPPTPMYSSALVDACPGYTYSTTGSSTGFVIYTSSSGRIQVAMNAKGRWK